MHTEDEAKKLWCPMVREATMEGNNRDGPEHYAVCLASGCAFWRWLPLTTAEPGWKEAMKTLIDEGMNNAQAAKEIQKPETKRRFGLPEKPYRGFCGLAGRPES